MKLFSWWPGARRPAVGPDVAALKPGEFRRGETLWGGPPGSRDTLFYFTGDGDSARLAALAAKSGLGPTYAIAGTPMRVVTDVRPADLPRLGPLLRPVSP